MTTAPASLRPARPRTGWKTLIAVVVIAGITVWSAFAVQVLSLIHI